MNDPGRNEQITNQAKELFDDSVERLDAATLSRLNQGRHRALEELRESRHSAQWLRWVPAAGVAAVAVVAVMMMRGPDVVELAPTPGLPAPDFLVAKLAYKLITYRFQDRLGSGTT